jgi:hypothetical protein
MAKPQLGYWDYLRAAFNWKVALPLLGSMPLNKFLMAGFAILGFGHPGFWLLGLGLEVGYLMMLAGHPRFQRLVRGTKMARVRESWDERERDIVKRLDKEARERYLRLAQRCHEIVESEPFGDGVGSLSKLKVEGLNKLLLIYLKLLSLEGRIRDTLAKTRREELVADIERLQEKLAEQPETSSVHRALKGTLEIQQARLANLDKSVENLQFTETELNRIEMQVNLIAEEVAVSKDPEQLSLTLDGVVNSIQGTTKWMADNAELFDSIDVPASVDLIEGARMDVVQKQ